MAFNQTSLSPQDELNQIIARLRPPAPPAPAPDAAGGIVNAAAPAAAKVTAPIATPNQPVPVVPPQRATDTAELNRLKNTGAGVEQLQHKHPIIGTIARIGDAALSSLFPAVAANIPGTELHHAGLVNRQQARVNQDLAGEKEAAQTAGEEAGTEHTQAETGAIPAHTALENAQAAALTEPKPKEENWAEFANFTDIDGTPLIREQNSGQVVRASDKKPPTGFKPVAPKSPGDDFEQLFQQGVKEGKYKDTTADRLRAERDLSASKGAFSAENAAARQQQTEDFQQQEKGREHLQKTEQDYHDASEKADTLRAVVAAAQGGNKIAGSLQPLLATLGVTTMEGVKRINNTELQNVAGAGNLLDRIRGKAGKLVSGEPIPPDLQKDLVGLADVLQKSAYAKYRAGHQSITQRYRLTDEQPLPEPTGGETAGAPPAGARIRDYTQLSR